MSEHEETIALLRGTLKAVSDALEQADPDVLAAFAAGRLRLAVTVDGVHLERRVEMPDPDAPSPN